jgi:DMSO/TMAO reductase YedYZ molybdopterin-dependent catalytic subunit
VADDPEPIDPETWSLQVDGAVERSLSQGPDLLAAADSADMLDPTAEREAILDCTSGWYSAQRWRGIAVGDLLEAAGARDDARWVSFHSVTGYRWSLPIDEAREALLATHVTGERLSHAHGFPLRLVAPGRRGFQWVKWVERVEVRERPDYGQWIAIFTSGFE